MSFHKRYDFSNGGSGPFDDFERRLNEETRRRQQGNASETFQEFEARLNAETQRRQQSLRVICIEGKDYQPIPEIEKSCKGCAIRLLIHCQQGRAKDCLARKIIYKEV